MRVLRGLDAPAPTTRYLVLAVPYRPTSAHDVHRAINPVENRDSTTQATSVLDLEDHVEQAVTIKVTDRVHGIELGRPHEPVGAQSTVCPERNTSERAAGKLSTRGEGLKRENCREQELGRHSLHTCTSSSSLGTHPRPSRRWVVQHDERRRQSGRNPRASITAHMSGPGKARV